MTIAGVIMMETTGGLDSQTSPNLLDRLGFEPADTAAWVEFVQRYRPRILAWCGHWGVQGADADDVAQEVLAGLIATMREFRYDPSRSFRAWLKTVTRHTWANLDAKRRRGHGKPAERPDAVLDAAEARDDLQRRIEAAYDLELVEAAIERVRGRVSESTWLAFRLTVLEGLSGAEAATQLRTPVGTVFVAKHRFQKALQQEIQAREDREAT